MSEDDIPGRVRRAFGDHGSFERVDDRTFESVTTPFDDAGAVIDYVEGTFVEGIIPGYDYGEPVTSLIQNAKDAAGAGF